MKPSWCLQRFAVTDGSPHWSFLLVLFWVALTSLAAGAALALAVNAAFLILAVFGGANLLFMSLCVILAKRGEARSASGSPAEWPSPDAADKGPPFVVLPAHARAADMTRVLFSGQSYFPVTQGSEVVGTISKGRLLCALAHGQGDRLIAELMNHASSARPVLAR